MQKNSLFIGDSMSHFQRPQVKGEYVTFENEVYYKISNSNVMRPFFMSIVSDSNHWMFISSNGALTAGRKNSDAALFPYYTDDKITELGEITGSKTIFRVHKGDKWYLWEPFSDRYNGVYDMSRNLYKNTYGNKIIFEEVNKELGLTFRYQWNSSNTYGFVRQATLINTSGEDLLISLLDGLQNVLPYGLNEELQNSKSNLVDAYKKSELEAEVGLGIYSLSAIIVDKAEPSEALKANVVWSLGLDNAKFLISSVQLDNFRRGESIQQEEDIRAEKGAYFMTTDITVEANSSKEWMLVSNVNQGPSEVIDIFEKLRGDRELKSKVLEDVELGTQNLINLTATADSLQKTGDDLRTSRHYSNVLYNIMRGGIFDDNYVIDKVDFNSYLEHANKSVWKHHESVTKDLASQFSLFELKDLANRNKDPDFRRLCLEYLPLKFSRRHGDPSRPWNKFSINTRSEIDGSKILDYEGNWRDIFQNWEALAHSFPGFIDNMIHKFLNASTFEGYNPYRITKSGIDWEVIEEHDPWSYIGYWGDHQIIYLLKFLEIVQDRYPINLTKYFKEEVFVYANVPYKIRSYEDILRNPKDTIDFDYELDRKINERKEDIGADGALMKDPNSEIYHVNFLEKILATLLAKCSNFIPEGGIWLNTQRPEWNDANNALVGNGVSMVTLYYLRRFLTFFKDLIANDVSDEISLSKELVLFYNGIVNTLEDFKHVLNGEISNIDRKRIVDGLAKSGSAYRMTIYAQGFSGEKKQITKSDLGSFLDLALKYLDHSIEANKRKDGLYHAYNLMSIDNENEISISYLNEMLEGQVAALSSGYLSPEASLKMLDALKESKLFREDQYSYLLYPDKALPRFISKNKIPSELVNKSSLLIKLVKEGNNRIIEKDIRGDYHFNGNFNNANSLKNALNTLSKEQFLELVEKDKELVLQIFEEVFDHKSFTGRSGTFFGYEGLGSIYWHMVSKLLLAVQECCLIAIETQANAKVIGKLIDHYYEINEGIGMHKAPELYGAFPTDPYSHTPAHKGAQQPGMTGQVKEDILSRIGELGVMVKKGKLGFGLGILNKDEFLKETSTFTYVDLNSKKHELSLDKDSLCFTYCQIPIIYSLTDHNKLVVFKSNKEKLELDDLWLDEITTKSIFERNGEIQKLEVHFKS